MCGYHKVVETTQDDITIEHRDSGKNVILPRQDTKIWYCLVALVALKVATTAEVNNRVNKLAPETQTASEVSSQLTILRYRGLVEVVEYRKGLTGGSTWKLTERGKELTENL